MRSAIAFAMLAVGGCKTVAFRSELAISRASFEMQCSGLTAAPLGGDAFAVQGCGKRAVYLVLCPGGAGRRDLCTAVPNSAPQ